MGQFREISTAKCGKTNRECEPRMDTNAREGGEALGLTNARSRFREPPASNR